MEAEGTTEEDAAFVQEMPQDSKHTQVQHVWMSQEILASNLNSSKWHLPFLVRLAQTSRLKNAKL